MPGGTSDPFSHLRGDVKYDLQTLAHLSASCLDGKNIVVQLLFVTACMVQSKVDHLRKKPKRYFLLNFPEPNVRLWPFGGSRLQTETLPGQSFPFQKAGNGIKYKDVESSVEQSATPPFTQ